MEVQSSNYERKRLIFPWVTFYTLAICLMLVPFKDTLPLQGEFITNAVTQNYWNLPLAEFTFVGYMFQHSSIIHFGINAIVLYAFGTLLEVAVGHGRTVAFYLISGVVAGLAQYFAMPDAHLGVVGLSGVDFAVLALALWAFPDYVFQRVRSFDVKVWHVVLVIFAMQLLSPFLHDDAPDRTAYAIHLGGVLAGFSLWAFWLRRHIERFRQSRKLMPETEIGVRGVVVFSPSLFY
jgi:membrane associated rhomboid family serine protease